MEMDMALWIMDESVVDTVYDVCARPWTGGIHTRTAAGHCIALHNK